MRLLTGRRIVTLIIVGALLAINVVALRWSSHFFSSKKQPVALLRYGDRLPTLKAKSLMEGQTVELAAKNPLNVILYFSLSQPPGFSTELVKYAETLSQRHKSEGLGITVIVQQEIRDLKTLLDHKLVTYDVLVDENEAIQDRLGLQSGEEGVFVFNKEGLCVFSTRRSVSASDLRQLVAVELLKTDPFATAPESAAILRQGKSLGSLSLLDARSLTPTNIDTIRSKSGVPTYYIFFTADCSVCSLPQYLKEFRAFRKSQLENDSDAVLVFDFNFPKADVLQELRNNDVSSPSYLVKEPLPALEYTDQQYRILERSVAVIETDAQRKVLNIYPLKSHLAERKGTKVSTTKASSDATDSAYEEMFNYIPFTAYDVATHQGKYFLTDFEGNRLLVINGNMEVEKDFGRIGSAPGRLFHPGYLDISRDGTIFVEDGGNERIVKFDQAGNYLGDFRVPEYQGLAVGTQNELYLGQPEEGFLVTVYSSSGKKLRSFGQLKKFSDIYGEGSRDKDEPYKLAFNRVRLATDGDGNLYVSFMLTPLIQKYSADGKLVFERRLQAPEIDRLMEAIQKQRFISTQSDGVDARIVALDPVIDPANGNIMVPLVDGSIYVADREGNKLTLLQPTGIDRGDGTFHPFIAGLGAKGELMTTPFPPKRWYRLAIKDDRVSALSRKESTVAGR